MPMHIDLFEKTDIENFLELAKGEGWLCDRWEFDFLLRQFQQGCLVCRSEGREVGYITSVSYGCSGWIGNLIVHPAYRGRGIGRRLMERALSILLDCSVKTVWLTASQQGAGLYRQLGFQDIDRINRWQGSAGVASEQSSPVSLESLQEIDGIGWGARRDALVVATSSRGSVHSGPGSFLCCQQWDRGVQVGPWGAIESGEARQLLDAVLTDGETEFFMDVPAGNFAAASLLSKRGFSIVGSSILMYFGDHPSYRPDRIFALASMGSSG